MTTTDNQQADSLAHEDDANTETDDDEIAGLEAGEMVELAQADQTQGTNDAAASGAFEIAEANQTVSAWTDLVEDKRGQNDLVMVATRSDRLSECQRRLRPIEEGLIYHVIDRGNNRQDVFHKDADFEAFLRALGRFEAAEAVSTLRMLPPE